MKNEISRKCTYLHSVKPGFDTSYTFYGGDSHSMERADGHQACSDGEVSFMRSTGEKKVNNQVLSNGQLGNHEKQPNSFFHTFIFYPDELGNWKVTRWKDYDSWCRLYVSIRMGESWIGR